MSRPGVEIVSRSTPPARGAPSDTGTWFVGGLAEKGPTNEPQLLRNMNDFERIFGARPAYGFGYDSVEVAFRIGAEKIYFVRTVGPAADYDDVTLNDGAATAAIAVRTIGQNASDLTVQVVAGTIDAAKRVLVIADSGTEVERSPELATNQAIVDWSTSSDYVRVSIAGAGGLVAVVGATALAGGTDDRASITDTHRANSLALFTKALGPGQISYPGATTAVMHAALMDHAQINNRVAVLDFADTASDTTLKAAADADRAEATLDDESESFGAGFAPWVVVPGVTRNTTRTVPPSAVVAGLIARTDGRYNNPNLPAAGVEGETDYPVGLSQVEWSDAVREQLNTKGVNVLRMVYGALRVYGFRSLVDPDGELADWLQFSSARTRMAVSAEADAIGEQYVFSQIDGQGKKLAEFNGALRGMLQRFWTIGALYGESADEAYVVDTGATVNTPTTIANGELRAVIGIRTSPFAELVYIELVKVSVTESL